MNTTTFTPGMTPVIRVNPKSSKKSMDLPSIKEDKIKTIKKRIIIAKEFSFWGYKFSFLKMYVGFFSLIVGVFFSMFVHYMVSTIYPVGVYASYQPQKERVKAVAVKKSKLEALRGTPMEGAIPSIKAASAYFQIPEELFLGIAFAESSFKRFKCYNPYGVDTGKGNDPRCFTSWEHSSNFFAQMVKYNYWNEGRLTPEQLLGKYVGWSNNDWVKNVKTYYDPKIEVKF